MTAEKPAVTVALLVLSVAAEGATSVPAATPSVRLLPDRAVAIVPELAMDEAVTALLLREIAADDPTVVSPSLATVKDNKGLVISAVALLPKSSVVASTKDCTLVCATTASRTLAPATTKLPVFLLPVVLAETALLVAEIDTPVAEPDADRVIPSRPFVCAMIDESMLL